jgi:membrane associated rhomboid family serine protease
VLSILGALLFPLLVAGVLVPVNVWAGELWRLASWVFFERNPISLVFACLLIVWLGPDLWQRWGTRRLLAVYLGGAALTGAATCAIARLLPVDWLMSKPFASAWPIVDALIIAWATLYPERRILIYFILPVQGRMLIGATIGLTVLFAIFEGWLAFVPHFVAQGAMLLYVDRLQLFRRLWLRVRLAAYERQLRKRTSRFTVVRRADQDRPPRYH